MKVNNITDTMIKYSIRTSVEYGSVSYEWEVQAMFFSHYNIKPYWFNCNFTWGWIDNETDTWTGAVGMLERDEADYAIFGFGGTLGRVQVTDFSPPTDYFPTYWLTRYPRRVSPTWNLLGLFTKDQNSQMSVLSKLTQLIL